LIQEKGRVSDETSSKDRRRDETKLCVKNIDVLNFVSNKYDSLIKSNCNFFVVHLRDLIDLSP